LLLAPVIGASSLAIASLAGPLVVLPILAISLARIGLLRATWPDFSKKFFAPAWRLARPILLTLGIGSSIGLLMLAHLIIRGFAADRGEGSVAALGYAFRLYELPLSLIANPAAVLMLPNIAVLYKAGHMADIGEIVRQTLLAGLVVLFPAAIVTWAGADLIVYVLLEHGNFGHPAAILTADALRGFAPAIIGEGILVVFYRVFYAMHRPSPAVIISAAALASLILFLVLARNKAFIAIPLSLSGGFLVGATILMGFLVREIGPSTIPNLPSVLRWGVCALAGLATWRITGAFQAHTIWAEIRPLIYFLLVYSTGILMLFADYRRTLLRILTSLRSPTS
jgi:putative peptidoglycan lipid II flippase